MKALLVAVLGAMILTPGALGHQVHGILLINGTASPEWKYVREVSVLDGVSLDKLETWDGWNYFKTIPQEDIDNPNITCGRNAFDSANKTETATVLAGSEVGFRVSRDYSRTWREGAEFVHPGPVQIYLSRSPNDDLEDYRGDGDWFKIAYGGPVSNTGWLLYWRTYGTTGGGLHEFNFTVPATTPPGRYLMRIEQFMPTSTTNYSQWFVNCAHVNIVGPGGGVPTGFAKFPGTYHRNDPGIFIPRNQEVFSGLPAEEMRLLEYKPPGPEVWTG